MVFLIRFFHSKKCTTAAQDLKHENQGLLIHSKPSVVVILSAVALFLSGCGKFYTMLKRPGKLADSDGSVERGSGCRAF